MGRPRAMLRAIVVFVSLSALSTPGTVAALERPDPLETLLSGEPDVRVLRRMDGGVVFAVGDASTRFPGEIVLSRSAFPFDLLSVATNSFYIALDSHHPDPALNERIVQLATKLVAKGNDGLGARREPPRPPPVPSLLMRETFVLGIVAAIILLLRDGRIVWALKGSHVLPALIQATLFAYWFLYWRAFPPLVPAILVQIALAYALDACVMLALSGTWSVGFGPIPIVLSANLFAWFDPIGTTVLLAAAIGSRALIRYRGRHLLNPSAFGLTVALALTLAFPTVFHQGGPFTLFTLAPNLPELVIVLALIPQTRFRIVLASLGVYLGLVWSSRFYPYTPGMLQPGLLLMITLFVTDPATIPRTPIGQLLFGVLVGAGVTIVTAGGYALGLQDERMNKVLPVSAGNLLVPLLDAAGERAARWRLAFLEPRWNLAHVALWLVLMVSPFRGLKAQNFSATKHWLNRTPLVVFDGDGVPRCEHNPIFCRPFTFRLEAAAWLSELREIFRGGRGPV